MCGSGFTCRSDNLCIEDACIDPLVSAGCTYTTAWSCDEVELWTADLSGCDLSGIQFNGSLLAEDADGPAANFTDAILTNALFDTSVSRTTDFTRADLTGTIFNSFGGGNVNVTDATLEMTTFREGGDYTGADFSDTGVSTVIWIGTGIRCPSGTEIGNPPNPGNCCGKWAASGAPEAPPGCTT